MKTRESEKKIVHQEPNIIQLDIMELERFCKRLEQSNREMEEFMERNGHDDELALAMDENISAVRIKREKIAYLKNCIAIGIMPTVLDSCNEKKQPAVLSHKKEDESFRGGLTL